MQIGQDYIGVGVGALIFNEEQEVFFALRGSKAKNEQNHWELPGGTVEYGETLIKAIKREIYEEYNIVIQVSDVLCVSDHILKYEKQHWVSTTFIAKHISGAAVIREPIKCSKIGWFPLSSPPSPLSLVTSNNLQAYQKQTTYTSLDI